jgi:hypothetical protein
MSAKTKTVQPPIMMDYGDGKPRLVLPPVAYTLGKESSAWERRQKFGGCFPSPHDTGTGRQPVLPKNQS